MLSIESMIEEERIPGHWKLERLGGICKTTSGGTPSRKVPEFYNGTIPWVKSGELDNGLILDTEEKITESAVTNSSAKIFPKGTLLIALYGASIGKISFLGIDATTNQAICGIFQSPEINHKFLFYFLSYSRPNLIKQGIGGAQPNISQGILKSLMIPVPPITEQGQIVEKIEELFSELDAGRKLLETLEEQLITYKQAVLKCAFEGRLTKKNNEKEVLPSTWRSVKLNEICKKIIGGGTPKSDHPDYWSGDIPWISSADIFGIRDIRPSRNITSEAINDSATNILPRGGIIVVTRVGLGKVAIAPYDICFSQDNQGLVLDPEVVTEDYAIRYLMFAVQSFKAESRGTTINGVTKNQLSNMKFILPPIEDQIILMSEIESRISDCEKLEVTIEYALRRTADLKQAILKQAFEGKLVKTQTN